MILQSLKRYSSRDTISVTKGQRHSALAQHYGECHSANAQHKENVCPRLLSVRGTCGYFRESTWNGRLRKIILSVKPGQDTINSKSVPYHIPTDYFQALVQIRNFFRISAGLARARLPKPAATIFHATSTCEDQAFMDTSSLPTILINWLYCPSKHSFSIFIETKRNDQNLFDIQTMFYNRAD